MPEVAMATRKQLNFIAVLARFVGANAVEECRTRCGCDPQELTKREAGIIITHLQAVMPEYLREVLHSYHKALVIRREEENAEPITPKQIGFALYLAQSAQVDAHYLCRRLFGCALDRLSKKSAFGMIEYLKALASPAARAERPEEVEAKPKRGRRKTQKTTRPEPKPADSFVHPTYTLKEVENLLPTSIVYTDNIYDVLPQEFRNYDALLYAAGLKWGERVMDRVDVMDWLTYHFLHARGYDPARPAMVRTKGDVRRALEEIQAWTANDLVAITYQDAIFTITREQAAAYDALIITARKKWGSTMRSGIVLNWLTYHFLTGNGYIAPRPLKTPRNERPLEAVNGIPSLIRRPAAVRVAAAA